MALLYQFTVEFASWEAESLTKQITFTHVDLETFRTHLERRKMSGFWWFCNIPYTDFTFISPRCKMVRCKSIKFQTTNLEKRLATNSFPTQKHKKKKKQSQNTKLRNLQALYAWKAVLQEHSHLPRNWRGTYKYKYMNPRFKEARTTDDYLLYNMLKH